MEASALHAPAGLTRLSLGGPLLRLRSDEQLVVMFRSGSDDAFTTLVDRYQQRLFAYTRQMLGGSRQDAEDVLQDVFVRAYGALRADSREVNVRAWLYRVAHNRCIDQLRRPSPPASEIFEMSRKPLHDPVEQAQQREDLRRLVEDVGRLPEQQRSALLMREIDGMSYSDLADALDTSVPAVKSLLVRARVGLVEAIEARDMDCAVIRVDLTEAYDRGVKASGRARRHMRECDGCREYRTALRGVRRSFAALTPLGLGPLAIAANVLGIGGAGGGAAASAGAGGGVAVTSGIGAVGACKVAAVVCTAALATGGAAVEVKKIASERDAGAASTAKRSSAGASARGTAAAAAPVAAATPVVLSRGEALTRSAATAPSPPVAAKRPKSAKRADVRALTGAPPVLSDPTIPGAGLPAALPDGNGGATVGPGEPTSEPSATGGVTAPETTGTTSQPGGTTTKPGPTDGGTKTGTATTPDTRPGEPVAGTPGASGGADAPAGNSDGSSPPPPEH